MKENLVIRDTRAEETDRVLAFYPQAFPDEDLRPVVSSLLAEETDVLSLAAFDGTTVIAHVLFTLCGSGSGKTGGALLAPLGVIPGWQKKGLGTKIVRAGLKRLQEIGVMQVFVLGDPAYYSRFGFMPESLIKPPCPIPDEWAEAWQSLPLAEQKRLNAGQLSVPKPWQDPALWAP